MLLIKNFKYFLYRNSRSYFSDKHRVDSAECKRQEDVERH